MKLRILAACITGLLASNAHAEKSKSPHTVRGGVEVELRSNSDIKLAPSSSDSFDFADFGDFVDPEAEQEDAGDDEEEDDSSDDGFDDIDGTDFDEDELEELDSFDEDGDGIDDLLDPDVDSVVKSAQRTTTKLGLTHKYQFADKAIAWTSGVKLVSDFNESGTQDKNNWALTTGPEFTFYDKKVKIKPSISYVSLQQESSEFLSTLVGTLGVSYDVTKAVGFDFVYNYQDKDVSNPDSPDAIINTLTFGVEYKATKTDIFKLKYSPKVEDSSLVTKNKDSSGWQASYSRKLPWDMILGLGVKQDSVDYTNLVPERRDDILAYAIDLNKEFSKSWQGALGFEKRERESNIPGKDGENRSFTASISWKF